MPGFRGFRNSANDYRERDSRFEHARNLRASGRSWIDFAGSALIIHGATRRFQIPRIARKGNIETVSRTSRGIALDGRENGDDAPRRNGLVLLLSFAARARDAGALAPSRSTSWLAQSARHHRFSSD